MEAGSYAKEIIDVVDKYNKIFFIYKPIKSFVMFEQIKEITNWQDVEINYKHYHVALIPFTQFYKDRNYRLVIYEKKR